MALRIVTSVVLSLVAMTPAAGQARQTSADDYTRYELLDPGTGRFKIIYDVTATTPGATHFFNPIRKGSIASDESVFDPMTGGPLAWTVVSGGVARKEGLPSADLETDYIRVTLPRPVPSRGEVRLRIIKTYFDSTSYRAAGDTVVFARSLSIPRNAVVLPKGFELIGVNYPSQVLTESGRIAVSFMNVGEDPVAYQVRGRRVR